MQRLVLAGVAQVTAFVAVLFRPGPDDQRASASEPTGEPSLIWPMFSKDAVTDTLRTFAAPRPILGLEARNNDASLEMAITTSVEWDRLGTSRPIVSCDPNLK